jgi:hypothetical protein
LETAGGMVEGFLVLEALLFLWLWRHVIRHSTYETVATVAPIVVQIGGPTGLEAISEPMEQNVLGGGYATLTSRTTSFWARRRETIENILGIIICEMDDLCS